MFFRRSKGLFNIEYLTVLIIFAIFSSYFAFKIIERRPVYVRNVKQEVYRSENYRLSEILINDPGHPTNWDELVGTLGEDNIKRLGLLDSSNNKTNLLNENKIKNFSVICSGDGGYDDVKDLLGTSYNFDILIRDSTGTLETIECGPSVMGVTQSSIKRKVAFDSGNYGELIVQIW